MDAKVFNGTTKYQKFLLSQKRTYLDYIKLHDVHGNPLGTVTGSFAIRPKINTCVRAAPIFIDFSLFLLFKKNKLTVTGKNKLSVSGKTKWSLNSK